jgi:predicted small lipoprotein YifL
VHHRIRIDMRNILILGSFLLALVTLGACGSKGPLTLPPPPAAPQPAAAPGGAVDNSTAPGASR